MRDDGADGDSSGGGVHSGGSDGGSNSGSNDDVSDDNGGSGSDGGDAVINNHCLLPLELPIVFNPHNHFILHAHEEMISKGNESTTHRRASNSKTRFSIHLCPGTQPHGPLGVSLEWCPGPRPRAGGEIISCEWWGWKPGREEES